MEKPLKTRAARWLVDVLVVGGAAGVAYGAWLAYPPAGFIVGGVLAVVGGLALDMGVGK